MNLACQQRTRPQLPGEELIMGIEHFNRGRYLECCRTLEFNSLHEPRQEKYLYQGIIQLAIGLDLWNEGDFRSTARQLRIATELLQRVQPSCLKVDVADLLRQAESMRERLEALGLEKMKEFDRYLLPVIRLVR